MPLEEEGIEPVPALHGCGRETAGVVGAEIEVVQRGCEIGAVEDELFDRGKNRLQLQGLCASENIWMGSGKELWAQDRTVERCCAETAEPHCERQRLTRPVRPAETSGDR